MTGPSPAAIAARRVALIRGAKAVAGPVVNCVRARVRPDHLLAGRTRAELIALVIVLAEGADPGLVRDVCQAPDDAGNPDPTGRERMLRNAHAEVWRLRQAGHEIPRRLLLLDREYWRWRKQVQAAAKAGGSSRAA